MGLQRCSLQGNTRAQFTTSSRNAGSSLTHRVHTGDNNGMTLLFDHIAINSVLATCPCHTQQGSLGATASVVHTGLQHRAQPLATPFIQLALSYQLLPPLYTHQPVALTSEAPLPAAAAPHSLAEWPDHTAVQGPTGAHPHPVLLLCRCCCPPPGWHLPLEAPAAMQMLAALAWKLRRQWWLLCRKT